MLLQSTLYVFMKLFMINGVSIQRSFFERSAICLYPRRMGNPKDMTWIGRCIEWYNDIDIGTWPISSSRLVDSSWQCPVATEVSQSVTCIFAPADERAVSLSIKMKGAEHYPVTPHILLQERKVLVWDLDPSSTCSVYKISDWCFPGRRDKEGQFCPHWNYAKWFASTGWNNSGLASCALEVDWAYAAAIRVLCHSVWLELGSQEVPRRVDF